MAKRSEQREARVGPHIHDDADGPNNSLEALKVKVIIGYEDGVIFMGFYAKYPMSSKGVCRYSRYKEACLPLIYYSP